MEVMDNNIKIIFIVICLKILKDFIHNFLYF